MTTPHDLEDAGKKALRAAGESLLASSKKTVVLCGELAADDKTSPQPTPSDDVYLREIIESCGRHQEATRRAFYSSPGYSIGFDEGRAAATKELQPKIDALEAQVKELQAQLGAGPVRNDAGSQKPGPEPGKQNTP